MFNKELFKTPFNKGLLVSAITATSTGVIANDDIKSIKPEQVTVVGTRQEGPALPLAASISVIDTEQIKLSGAKTIAELLATQSGIQLQDLDGSGGRNVTISMRGFGSNAANNTLVLVDGRKLNNPSLAAPGLNSVALKDIERIEIVQGSAGVLYGDQAVGGVINVITKKATSGEVTGSVDATVGSFDSQQVNASISQGFNNGMNYRVSGQLKSTDNYRDNNAQDYENALAEIGYSKDQGHISASYQYINDELRLPGSLSAEQVAEDRRQTNNPDNYSNIVTEITTLDGSYNFSKDWKLLFELADRSEETEGFTWGSASTRNMDVINASPRVAGSFNIEGREALLTTGVDIVRSDYQSSGFFGKDTDQSIDAAYAQLVTPLAEKWTATIGGRYAEVEDNNYALSKKSTDDVDAYELGISWQAIDNVRIFARTADAYRFANADENGLTLPDVEFLKPQQSSSYELGGEFSVKTLNAKVVLFDMEIEDELIYDPSANFGWGANINLPESERQGVNLEADIALNNQWNLRANYTYMNAEQSSGTYKGKQVPFVSENLANIALSYAPISELSLYADASYTGSRFPSGDDANISSKVEAFTVVNLNATWSIDQLDLSVRVKNLTNEKYSGFVGYYGVTYEYPQPERNYEASISYRF